MLTFEKIETVETLDDLKSSTAKELAKNNFVGII